MAPSALGTRIAELRALAVIDGEELSARECSRLAGLSHSVVGQLESGEIQEPRSTPLVALARVLGCELSYLASGEGDAPSARAVRAAVRAARSAVAA